MSAALKVVKGEGPPPATVGFGVYWRGRKGKRLPANWYSVSTSRPRAPYVLDLLLWVNPEPDTSWRAP